MSAQLRAQKTISINKLKEKTVSPKATKISAPFGIKKDTFVEASAKNMSARFQFFPTHIVI